MSPARVARRRRAWAQLLAAFVLPLAAVWAVGTPPPIPTASNAEAATADVVPVAAPTDASAPGVDVADAPPAEDPVDADARARELEAELAAAQAHHDDHGTYRDYPATLPHAAGDDRIVAVAVDDRGCRYGAVLDGRRTAITVDRTGRACEAEALDRLRAELGS